MYTITRLNAPKQIENRGKRRSKDVEHEGSDAHECEQHNYDINVSEDDDDIACGVQTRSRSSETYLHFSDDDDDDDHNEDKFGFAVRAKPYFVYLMACSVPLKSEQRRSHTHIGKSRDAIRKVRLHNEGRVNSGKRSTRTSAPHWRLEQWIGPFNTRNEARQFQRSWFRNTKGIKLRIDRGVQLASMHSLRCYTARALLDGGGLKHSDNSVTKDPSQQS